MLNDIKIGIVLTGLQNDHKELMKRIEEMLHALHAEARQSSQGEEVMDTGSEAVVDFTQAFVRVDSVERGSPAEQGVSRVCACWD